MPCNLECTTVRQSLHALFQLLTTGGTPMYCPQASDFAKALGTVQEMKHGDQTLPINDFFVYFQV